MNHSVTIKPGLIAVRINGRTYECKPTGYYIEGKRVPLAAIPLQARYLMTVGEVGEALL